MVAVDDLGGLGQDVGQCVDDRRIELSARSRVELRDGLGVAERSPIRVSKALDDASRRAPAQADDQDPDGAVRASLRASARRRAKRARSAAPRRLDWRNASAADGRSRSRSSSTGSPSGGAA